MLTDYLYKHQKEALREQQKYKKCLINMWCGTGKTRTFTVYLFTSSEKTNVIVFPSLGLITQYCKDYILSSDEPFNTEFRNYECLAFCSDNEKEPRNNITRTTSTITLNRFIKSPEKQIILVTYQSFSKFIDNCKLGSITPLLRGLT